MASSKAEILQASRERERSKRQVFHLVGLIIVVLIVGLFILILNLSFLCVTKINIIGQTSADQGVVQKFVETQLAGRYLGLVPKSSIFFVSKGILITDVSRQFPGLAKVTISWPDLNTLNVTVLDRESKVLWCSGEPTKKKCYYLAPTGKIYQEAPSFSDLLYIELHSKQGLGQIGDKVIDPKSLIRATAFLNFMKSSMPLWPTPGLQLESAEVYSQDDFIAIVIKPSDLAWHGSVLFNTDQIANELITNFHSVLKNEKFQTDWQTGNGRLDYLDLRFPGKAFYKFK